MPTRLGAGTGAGLGLVVVAVPEVGVKVERAMRQTAEQVMVRELKADTAAISQVAKAIEADQPAG